MKCSRLKASRKIGDLGFGERQNVPELAREDHRLGVLDESHAVDEHRRHRLGANHLPVRADLQRMCGAERFRQRPAARMRIDVPGSG